MATTLSTEAPAALTQLQFYDLPESSTLHIYWRALAAARYSRHWQYRVKRLFDLVTASMLLVVLSPFMLLIALAIKVTSRGPILFRQPRLMKDGFEFTLLKFRTMVDGADGMLDKVFYLNEAKAPLFKVRKDPRVTRLGRVLRKTFLDELPQLINVVRGEMSLVGPRPILAREVSDLPGRVVFRFAVPQGVTGPWQTHGHHKLTFDQQLAIERTYIERWSLLGDLLILMQTVGLVLFRRGA
jgi:lipopolysaccharide/colanic/teichoic acid biosynthesis glycosyltransferase